MGGSGSKSQTVVTNVTSQVFLYNKGAQWRELADRTRNMPKVNDVYNMLAAEAKSEGEVSSFELNEETGVLMETGLVAKDLQFAQELVRSLQEGMEDPLGCEVDPIEIMCHNRAKMEKEWYDNRKMNVTVTKANEVQKDLETLTYDVASVSQVANAMVSTLVTGFNMTTVMAQALVIPKICDFLNSFGQVYTAEQRSIALKEFGMIFVKRDREKKCFSVSAYRFSFASSQSKEKYWICTSKSHEKMYFWSKKATFTASQAVQEFDFD